MRRQAFDERKKVEEVWRSGAEERFIKSVVSEGLARLLRLAVGEMVRERELKRHVLRPYDCHLSTKAVRGLGVDMEYGVWKIYDPVGVGVEGLWEMKVLYNSSSAGSLKCGIEGRLIDVSCLQLE